jgi:hypothetical protein
LTISRRASDDVNFLTGVVLEVDGGQYIKGVVARFRYWFVLMDWLTSILSG